MKITYWSDYACPYCYIGEERLKKALSNIPGEEDIEVEMKAFQLDPTAGKHAAGDTQSRFAAKYGLSMEQAAHSIEHISKMGREEGLDFRYATTLFTNTMDAHRLTKLAASKGNPKLTEKVIERLFMAYFSDNKELADKDLLILIGTECGLDADEIRDVLETDQYQTEVILDEREASRYGIHAVPFFVVGQYGISGAQSVEGLEAVIKEVLNEQKKIKADRFEQGQNAPVCGPDGCRME